MEKLEAKHISSYLPYGLKTIYLLSDVVGIIYKDEIRYKKLTTDNASFVLNYCKLVLRPLSDLTRSELEKQGYWHHIDWLTHELQTSIKKNGVKGLEKHINEAPYEMIVYLLSRHYDIFGLIDKGLAVSYSEIKND